jgi:hypothetical protein
METRRQYRRGQAGVVDAGAMALICLVPGTSIAHPDHGGGGKELFPGEGVVSAYAVLVTTRSPPTSTSWTSATLVSRC